MQYVTSITDRTEFDVSNKTKKGYVNYDDLNRIEGNCQYLEEQLNLYCYYVRIAVKTNWTEQDFPYKAEADRIRYNVNSLTSAYHKMQGSPDIRYVDTLNFEDVNNLEQNIDNINVLIERMKVGFRKCGSFSCR